MVSYLSSHFVADASVGNGDDPGGRGEGTKLTSYVFDVVILCYCVVWQLHQNMERVKYNVQVRERETETDIEGKVS